MGEEHNQKRGEEEDGDEHEKYLIGGCVMVKVANGGFPRLAQLVAIFTVEIIRMFFDFKGFPNETRGVMWGGD
jgi:hypothetical protein